MEADPITSIKKPKETNPYKLNIPITIPKSKICSFQSMFSYIKKKLQIKNSRKFHIDSILKKCKGKFFKTINDCFQKCIKIEIKRLPQSFITNITISYNKYFMDKKLIEVYKHFNIINGEIENYFEKNYITKEKEELFKYLCKSTVSELYNLYLESRIHQREIDFVTVQEGKRFAYLYQFISDNFTTYYKNNKPNKKRKRSNLFHENENKFIIEKKNTRDIIKKNNIDKKEQKTNEIFKISNKK